MADFGPPPPDLDIFHLNVALNYIASGLYAGQGDRHILINNQNAQLAQLSQYLGTLQGVESAISSSSAQLSANIAALGTATAAGFDSLAEAVADLHNRLSAQIDTFNAKADNLLTLLEVMIQAFQGAATNEAQNQMIALLTELVRVTSPEKPVTIGIDLTHPVTTPQPTPTKSGP